MGLPLRLTQLHPHLPLASCLLRAFSALLTTSPWNQNRDNEQVEPRSTSEGGDGSEGGDVGRALQQERCRDQLLCAAACVLHSLAQGACLRLLYQNASACALFVFLSNMH